ncbi:MAG: SDR family NAD(P)-dependent oxidoreductase [Actinomycetota bacterium]|nr:SDR family NAD(P)-dependent oxidoreductase [Actinomycetota bacterium]
MTLPDIEVAGSVALVTGAAGGMGEHLALGLARRGASVVLLDRDEPGLARVAAAIKRQSPSVNASTYVVDLSDREQTDTAISRIVVAHPDLNLLFNNAGVALGGRFTQTSEADFDWLMQINLLAPIRITRALLPLLIENGNAHIVNTSSLFGLVAPPGQTAYSTSKFGLRGFSESLRHELGEEDLPVGVTVVHPGGIRTNIAANARVAAGVTARERVMQQKSFAAMLSYPADKAAEDILAAAIHRKPRLLIGRDAKMLDIMARTRPGSYWKLMKASMTVVAQRKAKSS